MYKAQKTIRFEDIPGHPQQVWGGWVWVERGGIEHAWTKRATEYDCKVAMLEACYRLGIDGALDTGQI
jgi:hypothetical protein